jgi:isopenicillin N synthase-like dioxygenase
MVGNPADLDSGFDPSIHGAGYPNIWPEEPQDFRKHIYEYNNAMQVFSERFTRTIALALGTEEGLLERVTMPFCGLSTIRYPPYQEGTNDGRAVHTDYSCKKFIHIFIRA